MKRVEFTHVRVDIYSYMEGRWSGSWHLEKNGKVLHQEKSIAGTCISEVMTGVTNGMRNYFVGPAFLDVPEILSQSIAKGDDDGQT